MKICYFLVVFTCKNYSPSPPHTMKCHIYFLSIFQLKIFFTFIYFYHLFLLIEPLWFTFGKQTLRWNDHSLGWKQSQMEAVVRERSWSVVRTQLIWREWQEGSTGELKICSWNQLWRGQGGIVWAKSTLWSLYGYTRSYSRENSWPGEGQAQYTVL